MSPTAAIRVSSMLVVIVMSSALLASIVSTVIAEWIEPAPILTATASMRASAPSAELDARRLAHLFGFNSSDATGGARPPNTTPLPPVSLQVLATMVASDARYSMALVSLVAERKSVIVGIGTELGPQVITRVERDPARVVLRDKATGVESTIVSSAPPSTAMASVSPLVSDLGIQRTSPMEVTVPRATLEAQLADVMKLSTTVHVMPAAKGLTLDRILPGSPLTQLGLLPGDTLTNINGIDLRSPEQWMEAFTRLRSGTDFQVSLERGGVPTRLQVRIR